MYIRFKQELISRHTFLKRLMLVEKSVTMRLSEIRLISKMCTTGKDYWLFSRRQKTQFNNVN